MTPETSRMSGSEGAGGGPEHLVVGHVARAHGTRGEVFVWPLTDDPEGVFADGAELLVGDERGEVDAAAPTVRVEGSRPFKRGRLIRLVGFEDRDAAESLASRYLLAPLERLQPLAEGELFYHQLLGLEVATEDGTLVGRVAEVFETEPAHLLEVRGAERVHLVPFTERIVRRVDLEAGRLIIAPPEGLLDL